MDSVEEDDQAEELDPVEEFESVEEVGVAVGSSSCMMGNGWVAVSECML